MIARQIKLIVICLFVFVGSVTAQDTIPKQFLTDFNSYYEEYLTHEIPDNLIQGYAQQNAYAKLNLTFYHKIYYNQPLLEDYIRSVLKQLLPNNNEINNYEIYITKSTEFNAFTINDGAIFVNIACLAQISSEAEFAFLLGHEYAHYSLKHGELSFKRRYAKKKKRKTSIKELNEYNNFSQKNEMASDSLAMVLGTAAGYDARAMDLLIQKLIFLQKRQMLRFTESYNAHLVYPTSHPVGEERLLKMKSIAPINDRGSLFILGEERFNKVKRLAEYEFLKLLDEDFDIHQAISFPLKKYLLTGNDIYLPTLTRSIRKLMLLVPDYEDEGFMITHFSNYNKRFKDKENILHHLHYEYPDSNEVSKMTAINAINLKKVPFFTYKQAFDYFTKKSAAAGYAEPYLDVVLHYGVKSPRGRAALNKYLSNADNLYHEYALKLKKNKLLEDMEGRDKVLLIGELTNYEIKKGILEVDRIKNHENRNNLLASIRNKYLEDSLHYKIYNYIDFYQENVLSQYLRTIEKLVFSGRSNLLLTYDPRLYYAFKKANINSLEYMRIQHLKHRRNTNDYLYYACFSHKDEVLGKVFGDSKRGRMTPKKATRQMYNMHKEQKTFIRERFIFKIKDRTEWRY